MAKLAHLVGNTRSVISSYEKIINIVERLKTGFLDGTGPRLRIHHTCIQHQVEDFLLLEQHRVLYHLLLAESILQSSGRFLL